MAKKHSSKKDHADVLTIPPLIPGTAIGIGWLLDRYALAWPVPGNAAAQAVYANIAVMLGGLAFTVFAVSLWPFWKTRQNPEPHTPTNALYTSGIYRHSRNPIYLAFVITQMAVGLFWSNAWILLLLPATIAILHYGIIKPEEAYLLRLFGDDYRQYIQQVRRWL